MIKNDSVDRKCIQEFSSLETDVQESVNTDSHCEDMINIYSLETLSVRKTFTLTILVPLIFGLILLIFSGLFQIPLHDNIISLASTATTCLDFSNVLPRKQGDSMVLIKDGECSFNITYCTENSVPVMNGLDFVQYFVEFNISDGVYNETETGEVGSPEYSYVYNEYTFLFKSNENKELFASSPEKYIPQVICLYYY